MRRWMMWGLDPSSLSWFYPSIQLPSPPPAASTRARGQLPASVLISGWGPAPYPRALRSPPPPAISVPPTSSLTHSGPPGQVAPVAARMRGGGDSFLCLLRLLPHPNSLAARHRGVTGEEPTRACEPHTGPEPPPTHCSGRRPAGPAPWPSSGLHRDPRPLRPRRPGPGASGAHLRRAHDAAAILAASSSRAAPAAAAAAAALCSARRGRAGPRLGRHCSAGPGAGPEDERGGT